jgi:hypothetical protein
VLRAAAEENDPSCRSINYQMHHQPWRHFAVTSTIPKVGVVSAIDGIDHRPVRSADLGL